METKKRRSRSKGVALAAVIAALYATAVVFFAPISFQAIQVRIADILLPLSIILGPPAVAGLTLGAFIGNFYASPFGAIDIVGGTIANLVATALAWYICRRKFVGAWVVGITVEVLSVSLIVGSYLAGLTNTPIWLMVIEVMVGEVVAVGIGGYILLKAVNRVLRPKQPMTTPRVS